ncbi:hypothetical protein KPL38_12185 [Clostridium psychrophilum]|nr:hypothetical protein [Clostridium psychrophilum]
MPIIFLYMFGFSGNKYFYFQNPYKNNSRILVAEETSWLLSGSTSFYERKYGIFIKPINQSITTDDGYRPFSNDEYKIKWLDEDRMQLDYGYGSMNIWKTDIISFK